MPLNPLQRAAIAVFSAIEAARECVATNALGITPRNNGGCSGLVAALSESVLGRSLRDRLWWFGMITHKSELLQPQAGGPGGSAGRDDGGAGVPGHPGPHAALRVGAGASAAAPPHAGKCCALATASQASTSNMIGLGWPHDIQWPQNIHAYFIDCGCRQSPSNRSAGHWRNGKVLCCILQDESLAHLRDLPPNTFGGAYSHFMDKRHFHADDRHPF